MISFKSTKDKLNANILDYPKYGLCPKIWAKDESINPEVKNQILDKLTKFFKIQSIPVKVIEKIYIIGSLTSYQYNSKSDLDVHVHLNIDILKKILEVDNGEEAVEIADKKWRKYLNTEAAEVVKDTNHPIEFYFEIPSFTTALPEDGIYNLLKSIWEKQPRVVTTDFDIEKLYPEIIKLAKEIMKELDVNLGEIERDIQDIDLLNETIFQFSKDKKDIFQKKLNKKLDEININIDSIIDSGQEVIDKRHKEYDMYSEGNIQFKYLQRYGYIFLLKQLEKVKGEGQEITEDELPKVEKIISYKLSRIITSTSESDLLVPMRDKNWPELYLNEKDPNGHRPFFLDKFPGQELKEVEENSHSFFFGPAFPRNKKSFSLASLINTKSFRKKKKAYSRGFQKYLDSQEGFLSEIYANEELSQEQISIAIENEKYLNILYQFQTISENNINKAIGKEIFLEFLYQFQNLSQENITNALVKKLSLDSLSEFQSRENNRLGLNEQQIDIAISIGLALDYLYRYQNLSVQQISVAIDIGKYLEPLYMYQIMSPELVQKVIALGKDLPELYQFQNHHIR